MEDLLDDLSDGDGDESGDGDGWVINLSVITLSTHDPTTHCWTLGHTLHLLVDIFNADH